ncbi:PAS domain S-box protein [Chitinophaga silvatica]|uniref:histidine kinase n=1 Tax=Chitinophaga silvatica TaxID=2282649 RepID=A0A3E1Y9V6_9BACT|nr:PAS domain S-box protein [Chitinophaga silvatica]RFS22534.1 PAS domain S-box protein [Chitinophaga silvatica]
MQNAPMKVVFLILLFVVITSNGLLFFIKDTGLHHLLLSINLLTGCTLLYLLYRTFRSIQYEHLFDSYPIPMWIYERKTLRFLSVNHAAVRKYGYSKKEFQQLTLKDIRNKEDVHKFMENTKERCATEGEYKGIWKHKKRDGSNFYVEIYSLPAIYYGKDARFIMAKDVDEQIKEAKEAHDLSVRFELLAKATNDAIYDKDLIGKKIKWNHGLPERFHYKNKDGEAMQWWEDNIHPSDFLRIKSSLRAAFEGYSHYWSEEYRFLCGDGNYKHVLDRGFIIYDNEIPARMIGIMQDIDKHVKQAILLEEQNKALKEIAWINSHEIRRPVVSILSITDLFDKSNQDIKLNTQLMEWLYESTQQLDHIIHKIENKVKKLQ